MSHNKRMKSRSFFLLNIKYLSWKTVTVCSLFKYNLCLIFTNYHCYFVYYLEKYLQYCNCINIILKSVRSYLQCLYLPSRPHSTKITEENKIKAEVMV